MASTSTTSQPIALPVHGNGSSGAPHSYADYQMGDGSYTGSNGAFNPASYTRHFLGSPISWRPSSFNAGSFHQRIIETPIQGSIDANEMRYGRTLSSSVENRESLLNALNLFDREGELCRNYTCCGLHLNDLHELLEHFETVHIVVVDGNNQTHVQVPFNPIANPIVTPTSSDTPAAFDPDDMELELDLDSTPSSLAPPVATSHSSPSSGAPTPPDTPISTPLTAWPSPHVFRSQFNTPAPSQPPSPRSKTAASTRPSSPVSIAARRPNLSLNLGASVFSRAVSSPHILTNPEEAFNPYARFAQDYSSGLPGAQHNAAPADEASMMTNPPPNALWEQTGTQQQGGCVPPALLFSSSASVTPVTSPGSSRVPSPSSYANSPGQSHGGQQHHPALHSQKSSSTSMPATPVSATPYSRQSSVSRGSFATPSLLLSKPFKCPKPNCNKSYKQANGLKYHMTHGSCNFAPPKDLEHVKDLLERKKREREKERERELRMGRYPSISNVSTPTTTTPSTPTGELAAEYGITELDLKEVEREAEIRMRPFACGVGDCQRRYKNMNGLRYHYQHSGEHGAQGLALLASGQHECLQGGKRGQHNALHGNGVQNHGNTQSPSQQNQQQQGQQQQQQQTRPIVPHPSQVQQVQVQTQGQQVANGINAASCGGGTSVAVPVSVCDQQSSTQTQIQPQGSPTATPVHVTSVAVTSTVSQPGQGQEQQQPKQQQQQQGAVYASQQNHYAYACYNANTGSPSNVSPNSTTSANGTSPASSHQPAATTPYHQQQAGYYGNGNTYMGMNLGLGLNGMRMGMTAGVSGAYTAGQMATFQQQFDERYREYLAQQQQQQADVKKGL